MANPEMGRGQTNGAGGGAGCSTGRPWRVGGWTSHRRAVGGRVVGMKRGGGLPQVPGHCFIWVLRACITRRRLMMPVTLPPSITG